MFLHRYLDTPSGLQETANSPQASFSTALPAYESLVPFDSENKWIITAKVDIFNANHQEHVQKGIDELLLIKDAFEGCMLLMGSQELLSALRSGRHTRTNRELMGQ